MSDSQESERLESHFKTVVDAICDRRVIPFLGAGASLCDRTPGDEWTAEGNEMVPNSAELTKHLAVKFRYPKKEKEEKAKKTKKEEDLALSRVSQYAAITQGDGPLYEELRKIFIKKHEPTTLHKFLAGLPDFFRNKKIAVSDSPMRKRLIIITTNYDDLLERAFDAVNERYHKLVYMATAAMYGGEEVIPGSFLHFTPDNEPRRIPEPNRYRIEDYERPADKELPLPAIIKIHGAVERDPQNSLGSYVITEDNYIDYLVQAADKATKMYLPLSLPSSLAPAVGNSHYLFLGYSLQDWNIRVAWRRIWQGQKLRYNSWAVQVDPDEIDRQYWYRHDVDIQNMPLADYVRALQRYMENYNV